MKGIVVKLAIVLLILVSIISFVVFVPACTEFADITGLPGSGFFTGPYHDRELRVSLSFDIEDLDDENETISVPLILELLDKHKAKGTFFITGKVAEKNPDLVRKIHSAGHELGLHTHEHLFPLFNKSDAALVASANSKSVESIWTMSYRNQTAFYNSLKANREALIKAVGDINISIFRSPCLIPRWAESPEYFGALNQFGISVDSSYIQDFSYASTVRTITEKYGITEVPVTKSDDILEIKHWGVISKMHEAGQPIVLFFHPKKFEQREIGKLDELLSGIENRYKTVYLTIGDTANIYS